MNPPLFKYPRTPHLRGSRVQAGDDPEAIDLRDLAGCHLVMEEKMDGANCAISFDEAGNLFLQSRGHYLAGGGRERQFELLKAWAQSRSVDLFARLGHHHVLFGEWLYAKHTVFYDRLPHYFLEFDLFDREEAVFLDTPARRAFLADLSFIEPVRVIRAGEVKSVAELEALIGPSPFISAEAPATLATLSRQIGIDPQRTLAETDTSGLMEGLYIKWEKDGVVRGRYKFVRAGFTQTLLDSGSHWQSRPILPNQLRPGADLFA